MNTPRFVKDRFDDKQDLCCKSVLSHVSLVLKEKDASRGRTHLCQEDINTSVIAISEYGDWNEKIPQDNIELWCEKSFNWKSVSPRLEWVMWLRWGEEYSLARFNQSCATKSSPTFSAFAVSTSSFSFLMRSTASSAMSYQLARQIKNRYDRAWSMVARRKPPSRPVTLKSNLKASKAASGKPTSQ